MSDEDPNTFAKVFSAVRYRAVDYVFESRSRFKVMKNLLALPPPYLTSSDLYPHTGVLADVIYRSPWIRGSMISASSLSLSSSVLNDLQGKNAFDTPERFSITLSQLNEDQDVIPSSNPDSPQLIEKDELVCQKELKLNDPCQKIFLKVTADQMTPGVNSEDLLLEETMLDFLSLFRRNLPTLQAKLSRLRVLPIADPLLSPMCDSFSENTIIRHHESYHMPPDVHSSHTCANIHERFCEKFIMKEESLLLHEVLVKSKLTVDNHNSICDDMSVAPEQVDEKLPVRDLLHKDTSVAASQYAALECFSKGSAMIGGLIATDVAEPVVLPTEMELEVPLMPNTQLSQAQARLSTSDLRSEHLSPLQPLSWMSVAAQNEMEVQLWKADKYPDFVAGFLLAEPELSTATADLQPLYEASKLSKLEGVGDQLQPQMATGVYSCSCLGFTENFLPEVPSNERKEMLDDFEKLPTEQQGELTFDISGEILPPQVSVAIRAPLQPPANGPQSSQIKKYGTSPRHTEASSHALQEESCNGPPAHCGGTKQAKPLTPITDTMLSEVGSIFSAEKKDKSESPADIQSWWIPRDSHRGIMAAAPPTQTHPDPLSTFMILRSQQVPSTCAGETQSSTSPPAPELDKKKTQLELLPPQEQMPKPHRWLTYTSVTVSENVTRERRLPGHMTVQHISRPDAALPAPRNTATSRVVQFQATGSQRMAYCELLAFAQPHLSSAEQLGLSLPKQADFLRLNPDHTHFLLKQQKMMLRRTPSQSRELLRDRELLFNHAALIHVLVTCKDLLLKCNLSAAVDYLSKAAETCEEQGLKPLLRKLLILLHLRCKSQEPNPKLLELQRLAAEWKQSRIAQSTADKILLIMSVQSDESQSTILNILNQQTVVTAICPEKNRTKLNGASVVSSVLGSVCVLVYHQHVGPDFPWNIFSLVVEYDPLGPSPWASLCRERNISYLSFTAALPDGVDKQPCCLEDNMAYALVVTGGLLNRPMLLKTLESVFNVRLLERSFPTSLQMFGSTRHYDIISVDESTAIMVQELAELCEERASARVVLRLTALALQYSCCWIILFCPDSRGGGFSSDAFNNLVLVYSSLVLGIKTEDLDVKVLMVSEVWELARWISKICFLSLMSSDQDPRSYLDRDWLTVTPSQEEKCLMQFPSINSLVSQLMLRRAPSLQWLLRASMSQLRELLPEVPQKVLKLFSDTTSLYLPTAINQSQTASTEIEQRRKPPSGLWTTTADPHLALSQSAPLPSAVFSNETPVGSGFHLDCSAEESFSSHAQGSQGGATRSGMAGRVVAGVDNDWTHWVPTHTRDPNIGPPSPFRSFLRISSSTGTFPTTFGDLGLNPNVRPKGRARRVNSDYGSKCWAGQERKRSMEGCGSSHTDVTPLKRGRLSYERVPGRDGGQTRLKLF